MQRSVSLCIKSAFLRRGTWPDNGLTATIVPYQRVEWQKGDLWWHGLHMEDIELSADVSIPLPGMTAPMNVRRQAF
jgi:hypothetical protein